MSENNEKSQFFCYSHDQTTCFVYQRSKARRYSHESRVSTVEKLEPDDVYFCLENEIIADSFFFFVNRLIVSALNASFQFFVSFWYSVLRRHFNWHQKKYQVLIPGLPVRAAGRTFSAGVLGQKGPESFPPHVMLFKKKCFSLSALKVSQISHIKTLHHSWPSNAPTPVSIVMPCLFKMYYTLFFIRKQYSRMVLFMPYVLKWPHQHQQLRLSSSASVSMIGSFPNPIMCEGWGHEVRSVFCRVIKITNRGNFLFFSWDICFLFPLTWMATISYISQLLCLFVGWRDNGAVFLNAQVVSLSFPFLTFPSSSSPPRPFSHLTPPPPSRLTCAPHTFTVSLSSPLPLFYRSSSFLPLYLAISLTSCPFLSHLSLLHWFADSWETEHKSILFITPHCTLHNPNRLFPLTQCKGTHTYTQIRLVQHWRTGTHMRPTNK